MREILFRGKRADNGKWVYGYYFEAKEHWHDHGKHEAWIATDFVQNGGWCNVRGKYAVDPDTVGQYTGRTDKNGKKIFEGDIVKVTDDYGEMNVCSCGIGYVLFYDGVWYIDDEVNDGLYDVSKIYYIEVIGNIHDNPELLKGE